MNQWDHAFEALFTITLTAASLDTRLVVSNQGASPLEFQAAIHSYLHTSCISNVSVEERVCLFLEITS